MICFYVFFSKYELIFQGDTLSKIVRLFTDYDQKQQTLEMCLSNKLDRLNLQCITNDLTDENRGMKIHSNRFMNKYEWHLDNWNQTCERLVELIEANELAQMNTVDLQTYSKLIVELDSAMTSYKRTIQR